MLHLNHRGVEIFINKFNNNKQESFWNGYKLCIWRKNSNGYSDKMGLYRNNNWGISETIDVNNKGIWSLPKHYVKYFK